jgi:nitrate reductase gamma subunit
MIDKIYYFIMVPMVYLAFVSCIIGIALKIVGILRAPKHPTTLKIFPETKRPLLAALLDALTLPTVREHRPVLWFFLMMFHIALALLIVAHLDLIPQLRIASKDSPHMIGHGAVGVILTISVAYLMLRRFRSPVRELSVPSDYILLALLFCVFVTGDVISWANSWSESGFVLTKQDFGAYLNGLIRFTFQDPRDFLSGGHYSVVVVHILLANLFLMVLPFSKIMHSFFALPLTALRRI